jgi:hypothetical protein
MRSSKRARVDRSKTTQHQAFVRWLKTSGVTWISDIDPLAKINGNQIGVVAKRDVEVNTIIATIPKSTSILSPQTCAARDLLRKAEIGGGLFAFRVIL